MKVSDLQTGRVFLLELETKNTDTKALKKTAEVFLYQPQTTGEILLQFSDQVWDVSGSNSQHQQTLEEIFDRNLPRLCWLVSVKQNLLQVQIHEFPHGLTLPDELPIGVDEKIIDDVRDRYLKPTTSLEEIISWLTQEILLDHPQNGKPPRTLLQAGQSYQNGLENSFQLLGKTIKINVKRTIEQTLRIEQIEKQSQRKTQNNIRPIVLANAEFSFCDASIAGTMRGSSRTELDALIQNSESYLALWQEYNNLEQEAIVEQARKLGWLNYDNYKILPNGDRRFFLQSSSQLREQLQRLSDTPNFSLEVASHPPDFANSKQEKSQQTQFRGQVVQVNFNQPETIDLRPLDPDEETSLAERGYIFFSLSGDYARLNRRQQAEERIRNATAGMPQLGLILEQQSVTVRRTRNYKPLTKEVKKVFNGMSPTPRQEEAIKVALNTPDIALIQGPPGTGKTKVITAIEVRLAEVAEETNRSITHRLLLTSFQHDAVENAAEKTVVFGLPAVRVGGRSRQKSSLDNIDRWRRERIEKLEAQLANTPETAGRRLLKQVGNLVISYARTPRTPQESIPLLKEILYLTQGRIRKELSDQLLDYIHQLKRPPEIEDDEAREKVRKAVRSLRTDAGSFSDDGAIAAQKVLSRLDSLNILTSEQLELLQQAADWIEETPPPFLEALTNLKKQILEQLSPIEITPTSPISNPEIESLLNQVHHSLTDHIRQSKEGIEDILEEYLDDLKTDPNGVRETLNNYTVVLAATCQQSSGKAVQKITNTDNSVFETVIVDEAARANPLDLFIPLSKAERRIVLVGDHRQLPHILEPDIEQELRDSSETTQEILQKSLFERLFNHLKNLEKQDGIKRTVTLDTQYRMHPVLGDFVSKNFYETHGEPHIESQRPETDFYHHLPDYNTAVASWINVPSRDGKERQGKSKSRPVEAKIIAEEVARLIKINPELTFGIITFYSAQVTEIWKALETVDLAQISDQGQYEILPKWRETRDQEGKILEQLRVGTVDAFQGKEFDVVFLSLVRSNTIPIQNERDLRKKYGFLMLENRLCVAMSRQKRLLIAVGDLAIIQDENASKAIPHLVEFYKLCCSQRGIFFSLSKGG